MKLLIATQNFGPSIGGIEQYGSELVRALCSEGANVTVLAPEHPGAAQHDASFPCTVVRYRTDHTREVGVTRALLSQRHVPYDALIALQWTSALLPALHKTARLAIVCHGKEVMPLPGRSLRSLAERRARAAVLARADHLLAVSAFTAKHAITAGGRSERVRVIHPGVDAARYAAEARSARARQGDPSTELKLLTVARLVERKGIDTVLRALPKITSVHSSVRYVVAGEGEDRRRLEGLAAQLGIADRVEWLGHVSHDALAPLYASADVFVLPSRSMPERGDIEGFGLVLLEAQASGTPVIAARSGGMPDAVQEGVSGLLVPASDPKALASAINQLLANRTRREQMGTAGQAFAQTMSWRATARAVLEVLRG